MAAPSPDTLSSYPRSGPYTNTSGVRTYSDDLASSPIPTGETRFPFAMNLKVKGGRKLTGRITSETALQYAANPEADLHFEADPANASSCCICRCTTA